MAQIKETQAIQAEGIKDIIDSASDIAHIIIEEEAGDSPALASRDLKTLLKSRADEIVKANELHDEEISAIAKTHGIAQVRNEASKKQVVDEIIETEQKAEHVKKVIESAKLPFEVDTSQVHIKEDAHELLEKLDTVVKQHESDDGIDLDDIKSDPKFDDFLIGALASYNGYQQ